MARSTAQTLKKAVASAVGAALILLSPGFDFYRAFGATVAVGSTAAGAGVPIPVQIPLQGGSASGSGLTTGIDLKGPSSLTSGLPSGHQWTRGAARGEALKAQDPVEGLPAVADPNQLPAVTPESQVPETPQSERVRESYAAPITETLDELKDGASKPVEHAPSVIHRIFELIKPRSDQAPVLAVAVPTAQSPHAAPAGALFHRGRDHDQEPAPGAAPSAAALPTVEEGILLRDQVVEAIMRAIPPSDLAAVIPERTRDGYVWMPAVHLYVEKGADTKALFQHIREAVPAFAGFRQTYTASLLQSGVWDFTFHLPVRASISGSDGLEAHAEAARRHLEKVLETEPGLGSAKVSMQDGRTVLLLELSRKPATEFLPSAVNGFPVVRKGPDVIPAPEGALPQRGPTAGQVLFYGSAALLAAAGIWMGLTLPLSVPVIVFLTGASLVGVFAAYMFAYFLLGFTLARSGWGVLEESTRFKLVSRAILVLGLSSLLAGGFGVATGVGKKVVEGTQRVLASGVNEYRDPKYPRPAAVSEKILAGVVIAMLAGAGLLGWYVLYSLVFQMNMTVDQYFQGFSSPESWMGMGMMGLGMNMLPPQLPNPKDYYGEAHKRAAELAVEHAGKDAKLNFVRVNGSMVRRELSLVYDFETEAHGHSHLISVIFTRNLLGGYDRKEAMYDAASDAASRPLEPYLFNMGSQLAPDWALDAAKAKLQGFDAKAFTQELVEEAVSGDRDLNYVFYADDGAEVRVNARTGEATVVKAAPAAPAPKPSDPRREMARSAVAFVLAATVLFITENLTLSVLASFILGLTATEFFRQLGRHRRSPAASVVMSAEALGLTLAAKQSSVEEGSGGWKIPDVPMEKDPVGIELAAMEYSGPPVVRPGVDEPMWKQAAAYEPKPGDVILHRRVSGTVETMLESFISQNSGFLNRLLGKEGAVRMIADAFRKQMNEGVRPDFDIYKDTPEGRRYLRGPNGEKISDILWDSLQRHYGLSETELQRYLDIQSSVRGGDFTTALALETARTPKADHVKAFRHAIHAMNVLVQARLVSGKTTEELAADAMEEIERLKHTFDVEPEDPAGRAIVSDLQEFLDKSAKHVARLSKELSDPSSFKSRLSRDLAALQYAADTSDNKEELTARLDSVFNPGGAQGGRPLASGVSENGRPSALGRIASVLSRVNAALWGVIRGVTAAVSKATHISPEGAAIIVAVAGLLGTGAVIYFQGPALLAGGFIAVTALFLAYAMSLESAKILAGLQAAVEARRAELTAIPGVVSVGVIRDPYSREVNAHYILIDVTYLNAENLALIPRYIGGHRVETRIVRGGSASGPLASGVTEKTSRPRSSAVEIVGRLVAYGLALAPAAVAWFLVLPAAPILAYAIFVQSLPLLVFTTLPKTKSRVLLTLPGFASAALAVALTLSGSYLLGALAAINAVGIVHYGILSTRKDKGDYDDEERGLVAFFSTLLNTGGLTAVVSVSHWAGWLGFAGPALSFLILAMNGAFDFKLKFFTSWGKGFAEGVKDAGQPVIEEVGRWWGDFRRSGKDDSWTVLLGYVPAGLYTAVEGLFGLVMAFATALPYGILTGFEKALADTMPGSMAHRWLKGYAASAGSLLRAMVYGLERVRSGGPSVVRILDDLESIRGRYARVESMSERAFLDARALWMRPGWVRAPLGIGLVMLGRILQILEWTLGMALAAVGGAFHVQVNAGKRIGKDAEEGKREGRSVASIIGSYMAVALSAAPIAGAYLLFAGNPVMAAGLILSSFLMAVLAAFPLKDGKAFDALQVVVTASMGAALAFSGGFVYAGLAALNVIGLIHLAMKRGEPDYVDDEGGQIRKAFVFASTLALAGSPALGLLSFWAGLPAAAVATVLLAVLGAFKFDHPFFRGMTEGLRDGVGEPVAAGVKRAIWWKSHLKFWQGGSWVAGLGAVPVFVLFGVEAVIGGLLGLASAIAWSPLRGFEEGFKKAYENGLGHRLFSHYNAFLSAATEKGGKLLSEIPFAIVKTLFGMPNLLTVPLGLIILVAGQVLQLIGTAVGAAAGAVFGLPYAAYKATRVTEAKMDAYNASVSLWKRFEGDKNVQFTTEVIGGERVIIALVKDDADEKIKAIPTRYAGHLVIVRKEGERGGPDRPLASGVLPRNYAAGSTVPNGIALLPLVLTPLSLLTGLLAPAAATAAGLVSTVLFIFLMDHMKTGHGEDEAVSVLRNNTLAMGFGHLAGLALRTHFLGALPPFMWVMSAGVPLVIGLIAAAVHYRLTDAHGATRRLWHAVKGDPNVVRVKGRKTAKAPYLTPYLVIEVKDDSYAATQSLPRDYSGFLVIVRKYEEEGARPLASGVTPLSRFGSAARLASPAGQAVVAIPLLLLGGLGVAALIMGWFSAPAALGLGLLNVTTLAILALIGTRGSDPRSEKSAAGVSAVLTTVAHGILLGLVAMPLWSYLAFGLVPTLGLVGGLVLESHGLTGPRLPVTVRFFTAYGFLATLVQSAGVAAYALIWSAVQLVKAIIGA